MDPLIKSQNYCVDFAKLFPQLSAKAPITNQRVTLKFPAGKGPIQPTGQTADSELAERDGGDFAAERRGRDCRAAAAEEGRREGRGEQGFRDA